MNTMRLAPGAVRVRSSVTRNDLDLEIVVIGTGYGTSYMGPGFTYGWFDDIDAYDAETMKPVELTEEEEEKIVPKLMDERRKPRD